MSKSLQTGFLLMASSPQNVIFFPLNFQMLSIFFAELSKKLTASSAFPYSVSYHIIIVVTFSSFNLWKSVKPQKVTPTVMLYIDTQADSSSHQASCGSSLFTDFIPTEQGFK